jgi:hypothetical protein
MKKTILAIAILATLPILASAEETVSPAAVTTEHKEHHMQNTDPNADQVKQTAPEHVMQNSNPAVKSATKKTPERVMRNN